MNEEKKETVVDTLFDVGETWASHGLKIAESALDASARTLTSVSKLLGNLAEELKREKHAQTDVIDAPQS
jgi:hypothetical protein